MDFMQIIFLWLKDFLERMKAITSFILGDFLPGGDTETDDPASGLTSVEKTHKKS